MRPKTNLPTSAFFAESQSWNVAFSGPENILAANAFPGYPVPIIPFSIFQSTLYPFSIFGNRFRSTGDIFKLALSSPNHYFFFPPINKGFVAEKVMSVVISPIDKLEILYSVVKFIMIFMMNYFMRAKFSSKKFLHDIPVLIVDLIVTGQSEYLVSIMAYHKYSLL